MEIGQRTQSPPYLIDIRYSYALPMRYILVLHLGHTPDVAGLPFFMGHAVGCGLGYAVGCGLGYAVGYGLGYAVGYG
jgi:hypothetical protein